MGVHSAAPPAWSQGSLLPPEVVEITLRVGLVGSAGHGQWLLEVRSATDHELVAMESCPHFGVDRVEAQMTDVCRRLRQMVGEYLLPF